MSEWINVNDRLPAEEHETVVVVCDDGAILTGWACYWHGASTAFNCWVFPHDGDSIVTHWMPLPPPPHQGQT